MAPPASGTCKAVEEKTPLPVFQTQAARHQEAAGPSDRYPAFHHWAVLPLHLHLHHEPVFQCAGRDAGQPVPGAVRGHQLLRREDEPAPAPACSAGYLGPTGGLGGWTVGIRHCQTRFLGIDSVLQIDYLTLSLLLAVAGAGAALALNQAIVDQGRAYGEGLLADWREKLND